MDIDIGLDNDVEIKERYVEFTLVPSGVKERVLLKNAMISKLVRVAEENDKSEIIQININENDIPKERLMLLIEYMNAMKGEDLPKVPQAPDDLSEVEKHDYYNNMDECYSDNYLNGFGTEEFRVTKCIYEEDPDDDIKPDDKEETKVKKTEDRKLKRERYNRLMMNWRYPYNGDFKEARAFVKAYRERLNEVLYLHPDESEGYEIDTGKCDSDGDPITEKRYDMDVRYIAFAAVANWFIIPGLISLAKTLFYASKKLSKNE
jgi:hypothetical protein